MTWDLRVGMKVVCVDASPSWRKHPLVQGRIYEIAGFDLDTIPGEIGVLIVGVRHPLSRKDRHPIGFWPHRFRRVIERKTSIEIFQKLLIPSPCKETA